MARKKKIEIFKLEDRVLFEAAGAVEAIAAESLAEDANPDQQNEISESERQEKEAQSVAKDAGPATVNEPGKTVQEVGGGLFQKKSEQQNPNQVLPDDHVVFSGVTDPNDAFSTAISNFLNTDFSEQPYSADASASSDAATSDTRELLILDAETARDFNRDLLPENTEILVLDNDSDATEQVDSFLDGDTKYDSIKVVGNADLDTDVLQSHLTEHGELVLNAALDFEVPADHADDPFHDTVIHPEVNENITIDAVEAEQLDPALAADVAEDRNELVIINSNIAEKETVLSQLGDGYEVLEIDPSQDAMSQIQDYLDTHSDTKYDAVHVLTHGNDQGFYLGSTKVTDASQMDVFSGHMADNGDFMLYGCNLASSERGQALIQNIADFTGCDVAASIDSTGVSGDWSLEYNVGVIESASISISNWNHNLASYTINGTDNFSDADDTKWTYANIDSVYTNSGKTIVAGDIFEISSEVRDTTAITVDCIVNITGKYTSDVSFTVNGGSVNGGTITGGIITVTAGSVNSNIDITGNLTVSGSGVVTNSNITAGGIVVNSGTINSGVVNSNGNLTVGTGGSLTFTNSLNYNGTADISGTLTGTGLGLTVDAANTLKINTGANVTLGSLANNETLEIHGGTLNIANGITSTTDFTMSGGNLSGDLNIVSGTASIQGGNLTVINNEGTLEITGTVSARTISNTGTLSIGDGGTTVTDLAVNGTIYQNSGSLDINDATLDGGNQTSIGISFGGGDFTAAETTIKNFQIGVEVVYSIKASYDGSGIIYNTNIKNAVASLTVTNNPEDMNNGIFNYLETALDAVDSLSAGFDAISIYFDDTTNLSNGILTGAITIPSKLFAINGTASGSVITIEDAVTISSALVFNNISLLVNSGATFQIDSTGDLSLTNNIAGNQFVGIHNQGTLNVDGTLSFTTATTKSAYGILNDGTVNITGGNISLTANSVGTAFEVAAIRNNVALNIFSNSSVIVNTTSSSAKNTFSIFNNGTVEINGDQINIRATGSNSIGLLNNTTGIVDIGSDAARVSNVNISGSKGVVNYNHFYIFGDGTLSANATTQITGGVYTYARATGTPTETYLDGITVAGILQNTGTANVMLNNIQFAGSGTINNSGSELFVTGKFSSMVNHSSIIINNTENGKMHFGTGATVPSPSPSAFSGVLFNDQVRYSFINESGAVDIQNFSGLSSIDHHVTIVNGQAAVHDYATFTIDASKNHEGIEQANGQVLYVTGGQASTAIGDFWQYASKNGIFGVTNSGIINYDRMILTRLHVKNVNPGSQQSIQDPSSFGVINYGAGSTAITNAGGWLTMTSGSLQGTYSGLENMIVIKCIDKTVSSYEFEFHTAKAELTGLDKIAGTVYAVRNFGELTLNGTEAKTNPGYTIITTNLDSDFNGVALPDSGYFRGIYNASIPVQIAIIEDNDSNNNNHEIQLHYRADIMDANGNPLDVGMYSLNATVLKSLGKEEITVYQIKANDPSNRVIVPVPNTNASGSEEKFPKLDVETLWSFYGNGLILSNTTAQSIQFLSTTSHPEFGTALYNSGKLTVSDIFYQEEGDYTGYNKFLDNRPDTELTDSGRVYYAKDGEDENKNSVLRTLSQLVSIDGLPEGGRPEADVEFGFELNDSQIFNGALLTLRGVYNETTGQYSGTINATSDSGILVSEKTEWTLVNISVATNFTTGITNEGKLTIDNAFGSNATIRAGLNSDTSKAILNRGSATLTNANLIAGGYGLYNTSNAGLIGRAEIVGGSFTGNAEAGIWNESLSGVQKGGGDYGIAINFNQGNTALSLQTDIKGGKYGIYNSGNLWADYVFLSAVTAGKGTAVYNVANPGDASNRLILYQNRNENAVGKKTISDDFEYQLQMQGGIVTFNGTLASSFETGVKGFDLISSKIDNTAGTFNLNNSTITVDQTAGLYNSEKMTLNLSGSIVDGVKNTTTQAILNDGTLNLTNGSVVGGGTYGIHNQNNGLVSVIGSTVYAKAEYGIYNTATAKSHTESSGQVTDYSVTIGDGAKVGGLLGSILNQSANTKVTGSAILGFIYSGDGKNYSGHVHNTVATGTTALGEFLFENGTLNSSRVGILNDAGSVRIKGGTINGGTYGIQNKKGGLQTILTIDGGTIKGAAGDGILNDGGQLDISGAALISGKGGTVESGMVGIRNTNDGTVTIKGAISSLTGTQAAILIDSGKMNITSTGSISGSGNGIQNIGTGNTAIDGRISNYDLAVKNSSSGAAGATNAASVTISASAVITGNAGKGTAIINDGNAALNFAGTITNYGIGIQHTNSYGTVSEVSVLTISGGKITVADIGVSNLVGTANITGGTIQGGIAVDNAADAILTIGTDGTLTGTGEAAVRNAGTATISTGMIVNGNAVGVLNTGAITFDNAVEIRAKDAAISSTAGTLTITTGAKITGNASNAVLLEGDSDFSFDAGEIIGFHIGVIQGSDTAVTINGGKIETLANGTGIIINAGSELTFTATSEINSTAGTLGLNAVQNYGTFNMTGGTIGTVGFAVGINNMASGTVTISDGTISSVLGLSNAGTATISGTASITGTGSAGAVNNTGTLTVSDGSITADNTGAAGIVNTGTLELTGSITDIKGDLAAVHSTAGTVTVSGRFAGTGAQEGTAILNDGTSKVTVSAGANINNWNIAVDNHATVVEFNGGMISGNKTGVMNTAGGTLNVTGTAIFNGNHVAIDNDAYLNVTGTKDALIQFTGNTTSLVNNTSGTGTLTFADIDGTGAVNTQGIVVNDGTVTFENSLIHGHQSSADGAAIIVNGGILNLIKDTRVHDNKAAQGGAIYQTAGKVYIDQSAVYANGNAIYLTSGRMDILNSTIAANRTGYAITSAGTLYLVNSTVGQNNFGGIKITGGDTYILNSIVVDNGADNINGTFTGKYSYISDDGSNIFDGAFDAAKGYIPLIKNLTINTALSTGVLFAKYGDSYAYNLKAGADGSEWRDLDGNTVTVQESDILRYDQTGAERKYQKVDGENYLYVAGATTVTNEYIVTVGGDGATGDTLRNVLERANAEGGGVIYFDTFSIGGNIIELTQDASMLINANITINGLDGKYNLGPAITIKAADGATITNSIFTVSNADATFQNLTIQGPDLSGVTDSKGAAIQISSNTNNSVRLDNVTISGGKAVLGGAIYNAGAMLVLSGGALNGNSATQGGAVYNASGSLTISNAFLNGNTATAGNGGAIYNQGGAVIVNGGSLNGNTASSHGGAIYNAGTSVSLTSVTISNNEANQGGAVYNHVGSLTLNDTTISGNKATDGAGLYLNGGTFATAGNASVLSGNIATGMGGAIYNNINMTLDSLVSLTGNEANQGGAIFNAGSLVLSDITVSDNSAVQGGAVYSDGTVTLNGATISGNNAADGAGLYLNGGSVTFESQTSALSGNIATGMGGAFYTKINMTVNNLVSMTDNKAGKGGAVYIDGGTVLMESVGMAGNEAADGAAFYLNAGRLDIFNSTVANHKGGYAVTVNGGKLYIVNSTIGLNAKGVEILTGAEAYILNSVIAGNGTSAVLNLSGNANNVASTIGGTTVNGVLITQEMVFGTNEYNIATGTITLRNHFSNIAARSAYLAGYGRDVDGNYVYAYSEDNGIAGSWVALNGDITGLTINAVTADQLGNTRLAMAFDTDENGKKSYLYTAGAEALAESFIRVVTTDQDIVDPADSKMSLREAIALAESVGGGVIVFDRSKMGSRTIKIDSSLGGMTVNSNDIQIDSFTDKLDLGGGITVPENRERITIDASSLSSTLFTLNGNAIKFSNLDIDLKSVSATGGAFNISGLSNGVILTSISITFSGSITATGGGIYNAGHGTILTDVSIIASNASSTGDGGGIYNDAGASITMKGGEVKNFTMTGSGGGIYNAGSLVFDSYTDADGKVYEVKISGNSAANGGGIYNAAGAVLEMNGGTISGNAATTGNGGAIYTASVNEVKLNGVTVSGNSSTSGSGGGIYLADNSSMTITGGEIYANNADKGNGGAIYNNGTLTLENVTVGKNGYANRAANGGAVWQEKGMLTIKGGSFSYNTATASGGAIYVNGGSMNVDLVTEFSNNAATGNGGAVYVAKDTGNIQITNAVFTANKGDNGGAIYIAKDAGTVIVSGGIFTGNQAVNATAGAGGAIYNDGAMKLNNAAVGVDGGSANTAVNGGGIYNAGNGNLTVNGGSIVNNEAISGGGIYNAGTLKLNADAAGNAVQITKNQATGANGQGGGLYNIATGLALSGVDFVGNTAISGQGGAIYNTGTDVTVNGGVYNSNKGKEGGAIYNSGALTFNGDITGNRATGTDGKGGGVFNAGTLAFTGTVSDNSASIGGGIYNNGTLTVTNATIGGAVANEAASGAGVYNAGTLMLDGVTMSNNIASANGGGLYNAGTLTLSGTASAITGNSAVHGGGIYNTGATLTISNTSSISGNIASGDGGGIYNDANAAFVLGDAKIIGNKADNGNGGGLYNALEKVLTVTGGVFAGNSAAQGGGIYNDGTLTLTGSTVGGNDASDANGATAGGGLYNNGILTLGNSKILGNTATGTDGKGGGIYNAGKTLTLSNGTVISLNSAAQGGGIYNADSSELVLTGATISDNIATGTNGKGGGLYNADGVELTVTGGTISSNDAQDGAGFFNAGILTLTGTTFSDNIAIGKGGGLYNTGSMKLGGATFAKNSAADGGALYNMSGTSTIENGTFTENTASANGGALYNAAGANLTVSSATFGGSTATGNSAETGGAIYNAGILALNTVTVSFNTASVSGGGIYNASTATVTGGTFTGNNATNGGALYNAAGANLTVSGSATFGGSAVNANKAANGGAIYNAGELNLDTVTVSFNSATTAGGGLYNTGNMTLVATTIASNTVTGIDGMGGGIYNEGSVTMTAGSITANTALNGKGGGIYNEGELLFDVDSANAGTNVSGNKAQDGAGLYLAAGTVSFNNVSVKDNVATGMGGAVYSSIDLDLNDANITITGNKALTGGAIYTTARLTLSNITVSGNTATNGILALGTGGSLQLTGGSNVKLTGNTATNGLVYLDGGEFTLDFGTGDTVTNDFSGNTVVNGGFLYLNSGYAEVAATAGTTGKYLSGFTVTGKGGLFYVNGGTLLVENMALTNNTAADGSVLYVAGGTATIGNSTLALNKGAGATVTIDGGALHLECVTVGLNETIGLRYKGGTLTANFTLIAGNTKANLDGIESLNGAANVAGNKLDGAKIFVAAGFDQETGTIALRKAWDNPAAAVDAGGATPGYTVDQRGVSRDNPNMNGKFSVGAYTLIAGPASPWVVTISDDVLDAEDGETSLREAIEYVNANGTKEQIVFDYDRIYSSMTPEQKAVYGTNLVLVLDAALGSLNIKVNGMWLDGKNIIGTNQNALITVDGSKLTESVFTVTGLNNTFANLTVNGGSAANGGAFNITGPAEGSSVTTLNNLTITQGSAANGGLIYANGGTLKITGGLYENGKATGNGGLIYIAKGNLNITGTVFNNGKAGGDGGAIYFDGTSLTISGNTDISGNTAVNGGAISFRGTTFDIKNTVITNNTATADGGAIHAALGAETNFMLAIHSMSGNKAVNGGALYLDTNAMGEEAKLTITGTISANTASGNGGGIYANGALKLNGLNFHDNASTKGNGGAVYATGALTVENGAFTDNSAAKGSGGAIYGESTVTVNTVSFTNNSAKTNGGAVYAGGALAIGKSEDEVTGSSFSGNSAANGGAIYANSGLSVTTASFSSNTATANGGAIYIAAGTTAMIGSGDSTFVTITSNSALNGGGIYNAGTLTIGKGLAALSNNSALYNAKDKVGGEGGAIYNSGTLTMSWDNNNPTGLNVSGNKSTGLSDSVGGGGFLYNTGDAALSFFQVSNNTAYGNGGAIYSESGNLSLTGMSFIDNHTTAKGNGGAVYALNTNVTINSSRFGHNGTKNTDKEGRIIDKGGALYFSGSSNLTIQGELTASGNSYQKINTFFYDNQASRGGAVYIESNGGTVSISNTTASGNIGRYSNADGNYDESAAYVSQGAGLWIGGSSSNRITLENVTVVGNQQISSGLTWGGGLYVENVGLNLINTTFYENTANHGSALYINDADVSIVNSTVAYNTATDKLHLGAGGGGIFVTGFDSQVKILNSIVAGNVNSYFDSANEYHQSDIVVKHPLDITVRYSIFGSVWESADETEYVPVNTAAANWGATNTYRVTAADIFEFRKDGGSEIYFEYFTDYGRIYEVVGLDPAFGTTPTLMIRPDSVAAYKGVYSAIDRATGELYYNTLNYETATRSDSASYDRWMQISYGGDVEATVDAGNIITHGQNGWTRQDQLSFNVYNVGAHALNVLDADFYSSEYQYNVSRTYNVDPTITTANDVFNPYDGLISLTEANYLAGKTVTRTYLSTNPDIQNLYETFVFSSKVVYNTDPHYYDSTLEALRDSGAINFYPYAYYLPTAQVFQGADSPVVSIIVTTSDDIVDAYDGVTSLREALILAEQYAAEGKDNTITFSVAGNAVELNKILDPVDFTVLINGGDAGITIDGSRITGGEGDYIFTTTGAGNSIRFNNITIDAGRNNADIESGNYLGGIRNEGAQVTMNGGGVKNGYSVNGGAILNATGLLLLNNAVFSGNQADFDGGAISNNSSLNVSGGSFTNNMARNAKGGAISNSGSLSVNNAMFHDNQAAQKGGAIYTDTQLTVNNSTFVNNRTPGDGGAIAGNGITVNGGTFAENSAENGGAIYSDILTVINAGFSGNTATNGGAIYDSDVTVNGGSFDQNSATGNGGAILGTGNLSVDAVFTGNAAGWNGGAIAAFGTNTTISGTFDGNTAYHENGGAVYLNQGGTLENIALTGNNAQDGAAVYSHSGILTIDSAMVTGNTAGNGSIIVNHGNQTVIENSSLNNNIANGNAVNTDGELFLISTTIAENSRVAGADVSGENVTIVNSTIAEAGKDGVLVEAAGDVQLANSIVVGKEKETSAIDAAGKVDGAYSVVGRVNSGSEFKNEYGTVTTERSYGDVFGENTVNSNGLISLPSGSPAAEGVWTAVDTTAGSDTYGNVYYTTRPEGMWTQGYNPNRMNWNLLGAGAIGGRGDISSNAAVVGGTSGGYPSMGSSWNLSWAPDFGPGTNNSFIDPSFNGIGWDNSEIYNVVADNLITNSGFLLNFRNEMPAGSKWYYDFTHAFDDRYSSMERFSVTQGRFDLGSVPSGETYISVNVNGNISDDFTRYTTTPYLSDGTPLIPAELESMNPETTAPAEEVFTFPADLEEKVMSYLRRAEIFKDDYDKALDSFLKV